jgi:hypothetical protein
LGVELAELSATVEVAADRTNRVHKMIPWHRDVESVERQKDIFTLGDDFHERRVGIRDRGISLLVERVDQLETDEVVADIGGCSLAALQERIARDAAPENLVLQLEILRDQLPQQHDEIDQMMREQY